MAKSKLDKEIEKLWNRLKDEPERGIVKCEKEYPSKGLEVPKIVCTPDLHTFTIEANKLITDSWSDDTWPTQISKLKKHYGIGPSISSNTMANRKHDPKNVGPRQFWWQKLEAHLSDDKKY